MVRPRKEEQTDLSQAIRAAAWALIARQGPAALSLRAIARDLQITAPAIYNYFPDRDALVTALIVEAYTSFSDSLAAALQPLPPQAHAARVRALGAAYREWAVQFPERFQLVFGTPLAGYTAPAELTMPAASRGLGLLAGVLAEAHAAGCLLTAHLTPPSPELARMLALWQTDPEVIYLTLTLWAAVQGLVSLEVGRQFPPQISDPAPLFQRALDTLVAQTIAA
jgi:AcrR family transcriptional regulator